MVKKQRCIQTEPFIYNYHRLAHSTSVPSFRLQTSRQHYQQPTNGGKQNSTRPPTILYTLYFYYWYNFNIPYQRQMLRCYIPSRVITRDLRLPSTHTLQNSHTPTTLQIYDKPPKHNTTQTQTQKTPNSTIMYYHIIPNVMHYLSTYPGGWLGAEISVNLKLYQKEASLYNQKTPLVSEEGRGRKKPSRI